MTNSKQQKLYNLGQEALQRGDFSSAKRHFKQLSHLAPQAIQPKVLCAYAYRHLGKLDSAEKYLVDALKLDPRQAENWYHLAQIQAQKNRLKSAEHSFTNAIQLKGQVPAFYLGLANVQFRLGQYQQAVISYRKVVELDSNNRSAHLNLAKTLGVLGETEEAEHIFKSALDQEQSIEAVVAYAEFLYSIKEYDRAFECYNGIDDVRLIKPSDLFNSIECAIQAFKADRLLGKLSSVLEGKEQPAVVNFGLSRLYAVNGQLETAEAFYRKALKQDKNYVTDLVRMLSQLPALPDTVLPPYSPTGLYIDYQRRKFSRGEWLDYEQSRQHILELTRKALESEEPVPLEPNFAIYMQNEDPMLECQVASRYAAYIGKKVDLLSKNKPFKHKPRSRERVRVGFVSPVFRQHAMTILCVELIELIDKEKFEIFWYGLQPSDNSEQAVRITQAADHCVEIAAQSNREVAERIHADQIDLLIDIYGYGPERRSEIFAMRPAPIIIQHIGYPSTMGAPWVDYIFANRTLIPPRLEEAFSENIIFLPGCRNVISGFREAKKIPPRSELGLPEEAVVMASMHQAAKLTPEVVDCWLQIMHEVPDTVLWLLASSPQLLESIAERAEKSGVQKSRILRGEFVSPEEHVARLRQVDINLDTVAFGGFNSNAMALWAGVPVVTLKGNTFATRIAADACLQCDLPETVTDSLEQYQQTVIKLATDKEWLAELKTRLADPGALPLFDARSNVAAIEAGLKQAFDKWVQGESPQSFEVP